MADDVRGQVAVAQHRRLRLAGRAAREQQDGDVVRIDERQVVGRPATTRRERSPGARRSVMTSIPSMRLEARHDVGAGDRRGPARGGRRCSCSLSSVEPVVDRRERQPGERRAEQRDRHGLGVEVDHPDVRRRRATRNSVAAAAGRGVQLRRAVRPSRREPTTSRSPAASATISSSIPTFTTNQSVRAGQRLGPLTGQRVVTDDERAGACLGAQHLDAGLSRRRSACRLLSQCRARPRSPPGQRRRASPLEDPPHRRSTSSEPARATTHRSSPSCFGAEQAFWAAVASNASWRRVCARTGGRRREHPVRSPTRAASREHHDQSLSHVQLGPQARVAALLVGSL